MFNDALNVPDDHSFSDSEIEALKQQRVNDWVAYIDSTQVSPDVSQIEPTITEFPQDPAA